jgi:uncharacterized membrane protein YeiH
MTPSEIILLVLEIIGTVAFAVSGAFAAIKAKLDIFGVLFIGCITAVGGGVFRDVLTSTTPYIFKKHVYALASIGGASVYYVMRSFVETKTPLIPSLVAMVLVVAVRLLAAKYRWSLPKVKLEEEE